MRATAHLLPLGLLLLALGCDSPEDAPTPEPLRGQEDRERFWHLRYSLKPLLEQEKAVQPDWVSRPFLSGLVITYVIDRVGSLERVTTAHLERWGIDKNRLHAESIATFTAPFLTEEGSLDWRVFTNEHKDPFLAAPSLESTFASSLILSPAFRVGVEEIFGTWEGLWVALPSRSSCRVHRPPTGPVLEKLRKEFLRDHETAAHPLLRGFLVTTPEGSFSPGPLF